MFPGTSQSQCWGKLCFSSHTSGAALGLESGASFPSSRGSDILLGDWRSAPSLSSRLLLCSSGRDLYYIIATPPPNYLNPPFFFPFLGCSGGFTLRVLILLLLCVTNSLPSPRLPAQRKGPVCPARGSASLVGSQSTDTFLRVTSCPESQPWMTGVLCPLSASSPWYQDSCKGI